MKSLSGKISVVLGFALLGCTGWGFWVKYIQDEAVTKTQPIIDSGQSLSTSSDLKALLAQKDQLQQAIAQLENAPTLPILNSPAVQQNLDQLRSQLADVERNVTTLQAFEAAQKAALDAATIVQKPPHPLEVWQQAQTKWQEAIQLLEGISTDSTVFQQAQSTLQTYRTNLGAIETRIRREQRSAEDYASALSAAHEAAKLAINPPHSVVVWQQVQGKWQRAITLLRSIPSGTFVSTQAKEKLQLYLTNQRAIVTQTTKEQQAVSTFAKAKQFFAQAQTATQNPPSSLGAMRTARIRLQQGIAQLRQIPSGTTVTATAADYLNHYQRSYNTINTAITEMQSCVSRWRQSQADINIFCTEYAQVTPPPEPVVVAADNSDPFRGLDSTEEEGMSSDTGDSGSTYTPDYSSDYDSDSTYVPSYSSGSTYVPRYGSGSTYVPGYTRSDGTYVRGHSRSLPGSRSSGFGSGRSGGSGS